MPLQIDNKRHGNHKGTNTVQVTLGPWAAFARRADTNLWQAIRHDALIQHILQPACKIANSDDVTQSAAATASSPK